jgi:hypothetical protein
MIATLISIYNSLKSSLLHLTASLVLERLEQKLKMELFYELDS